MLRAASGSEQGSIEFLMTPHVTSPQRFVLKLAHVASGRRFIPDFMQGSSSIPVDIDDGFSVVVIPMQPTFECAANVVWVASSDTKSQVQI